MKLKTKHLFYWPCLLVQNLKISWKNCSHNNTHVQSHSQLEVSGDTQNHHGSTVDPTSNLAQHATAALENKREANVCLGVCLN